MRNVLCLLVGVTFGCAGSGDVHGSDRRPAAIPQDCTAEIAAIAHAESLIPRQSELIRGVLACAYGIDFQRHVPQVPFTVIGATRDAVAGAFADVEGPIAATAFGRGESGGLDDGVTLVLTPTVVVDAHGMRVDASRIWIDLFSDFIGSPQQARFSAALSDSGWSITYQGGAWIGAALSSPP